MFENMLENFHIYKFFITFDNYFAMSLNHDLFVGKWYKSFLVECLIEIIGNSGAIFLNLVCQHWDDKF